MSSQILLIPKSFNPLPSPKQGETDQIIFIAPSTIEFQSAPLTEARGDSSRTSKLSSTVTFQSAPLTEARGDPRRAPSPILTLRVSIRSPHRSKGRPGVTWSMAFDIAVSIRSPHRSKGRRFAKWMSGKFTEFQSAPLTEARGDGIEPTTNSLQNCFNPLPSPKQGETFVPRCSTTRGSGFQSAPLTEARGDRTMMEWLSAEWLFQSAPLTEARGDKQTC